uniref:DUF4276 family protein n=1 Tax=Chryseobacterium endophyticum TaxID=1854762 RepID=A0AAU6WS54_9FLAO
MVKIFIEGDQPQNSFFTVKPGRENMVVASFVETDFRKAFRILFQQVISSDVYPKIVIETIGTISPTEEYKLILKKELEEDVFSCLLLDLDGNKTEKSKRIDNNWKDLDSNKIYFFVQEMESWILSQPDTFISYFDEKIGRNNKQPLEIEKYKHYYTADFESIDKPCDKLYDFIKYYWKQKYHKTQIAPKLIQRLSLIQLTKDFPDAKSIVERINQK